MINFKIRLKKSVLHNAGAPNEKSLAKYLKRYFLLSLVVSELFKGIFV